MNAQAQRDEQTRSPIEQVDTRTSYYKEEVDRLCALIEGFKKEKQAELVSRHFSLTLHVNCKLADARSTRCHHFRVKRRRWRKLAAYVYILTNWE
jgi:hypothetical protein